MQDSDAWSREARSAIGTLLSHLLGNVHGVVDTGTALCFSDRPDMAREFVAARGTVIDAVLHTARSLAAPLGGGDPVRLAFARAERGCEQLVRATLALADDHQLPPGALGGGEDPAVGAIEDACRSVFASVRELGLLLGCEVSYLSTLDPSRQAYYDAIFPRLRQLRIESAATAPAA